MAERINLGKVLVTLEGEWDGTRAYDKYCEVTNDGSSYVSKKSVPIGTLITDTTYWQKRASKGADGQDGTDGNDGVDAYQPFKGWYSDTTELNTSFGSPVVGDYAYVKGASASDPVTIYQCVTAGTWVSSGRTFNPSNNQEFASGEALNVTHIVDNLNSSSATDVLSAKQGKELKTELDALGPKISDLNDAEIDLSTITEETKFISNQNTWMINAYYKGKFIPVTGGRTFRIANNSANTALYAFLSSNAVTSGETPQFADGASRDTVLVNTYKDVDAPNDAAYLWVSTQNGTGKPNTPTVILKGRVNVLENEVKGLKTNMSNLIDITAELSDKETDYTNNFVSGSYVRYDTSATPNLSIVSDSLSRTGVIPVKKGDVVTVNTSCASTVAVICMCSSDGTPNVLLKHGDGQGIHDYTAEIPYNGYVMLSAHPGYHTATIFRAGISIESLQESIERNAEDIADMSAPKSPKLYPNTKLPVISFEFDDIADNDAQVVELFEEYGARANFAFIASTAKITQYAKTYLMYQSRGHGILAHSVDGKIFDATNYTESTAMSTFVVTRNRLEAAGMVVSGWVSPSSTMDASFIPLVKKAYAYAFTTGAYNNRSSNPCQITRYSMQANSIAAIKSRIDSDIANDKILTLYGHSNDFGTSYPQADNETWNVAKLREILEYVIAKANAGLVYFGNTDDCVKYYFDL